MNIGPEKRLGLSWLLEMFRGATVGESFDSILAQQASFLLCYEQAVVFNYWEHTTGLSTNLRGSRQIKHQHKWAPSDVIHPV